ncbi:L-xylulose reductase [Parasteatoda tepidariorum]|uniref:L-xylulose reductase n=1 Tax=Parasteatoda tepidariorum TaxID=114398 RepID=UPI00077F93D5|nr:L-xylulose reductase [Parasteatoda tepidariorum]
MNFNFAGKRALVTGAGKGVGKALTLKLAELGAEVLAVSRTQSDLDALTKTSPKIKTLLLDIGKWSATKEALKNVGPIDFLVNNAAIMDVKEYGDISEQEVDRTFDINVKAIINISQLIANQMKERGEGGSIVNVSSMLGLQVGPAYGVYCASKGAAGQVTRSMACEFGPHKIRVNSVNPTVIHTRMTESQGLFDPSNEFANRMKERTPLRRFAEVSDVIKPVIFLLSDNASMITGVCLPIDGGLGVCFP